ncbi:membrane protein [Candidatus Omnitrophus magneticus]|uniref:Membrane protein n=1 Tax=Candidatus Omnitrophus magneticus TaxID=1609969 RepID=A0A0F0CR89_9BACT|nr:membrane protein [Candidatus Omnitrophus magneticus]
MNNKQLVVTWITVIVISFVFSCYWQEYSFCYDDMSRLILSSGIALIIGWLFWYTLQEEIVDKKQLILKRKKFIAKESFIFLGITVFFNVVFWGWYSYFFLLKNLTIEYIFPNYFIPGMILFYICFYCVYWFILFFIWGIKTLRTK